jgi:regulatory protein
LPRKPLSPEELLEKAAAYSAYQERSEYDIHKKLISLGASESVAADIVLRLKAENFISDQRFAKAFTRGRFKSKKWGRNKIKYGLLKHGIQSELAEECIYSIDECEYRNCLEELLENRIKKIQQPTLKDKSRVFNYLQSKGFEYHLIMDC